MSRIDATFSRLQSQRRKALIPYVTAGFPQADSTPALMQALVQGGADIIELGVPFSDPMADGPVIQQAGERALRAGVGLVQVLDMVRAFEAASGRPVPYALAARRPGDIAACYADPALAQSLLGWTAKRGIGEMCRDAWRWQQSQVPAAAPA